MYSLTEGYALHKTEFFQNLVGAFLLCSDMKN